MVCPNCHEELKENTKICTKCGYHLTGASTAGKTSGAVCKKCGAVLKPGAKFCVKCGKQLGNISRRRGGGLSLRRGLCVAGGLLVLLGIGTAGFFVWKNVSDRNAADGPANAVYADNTVSDGEMLSEEADQSDVQTDEERDIPNADTLFADTDAQVETVKSHMDEDAEIINVMDGFQSAVDAYVTAAKEAGNAGLASGRVEDTYDLYVETVNRHKDMMSASTLSGAIYAQVMMELDAAAEFGEELAGKGYGVDWSRIEMARNEFDRYYREQIINTFDEFTTRDMWSRTEAWNLMKDTADNMFDPTELDSPIRLRYAYALAWWTQKQIETELASGVITEKGAAIKIAGLIEMMDYNPMMVDYYIRYMAAAGEDCSSVAAAYDDIVRHIKDTQGIEIGKDIDLAHFWYFNNVSDPSVGVLDGSVNGVTQENREWIRRRMEYVEFVRN